MKVFFRKRELLLAVAVIALLVLFQNCAKPKVDGSAEPLQHKSYGNGYGYDGKLKFIKVVPTGMCPDEKIAQLEIKVRRNQAPFPDSAFIERENCKQIEPKVLQLGVQAILSADLMSLKYVTDSESIMLVRDPNPDPAPVFSKTDLYVSPGGDDSNPGTQEKPLRTIQKSVDSAVPGTTVHVAPGVYAESIDITRSGTDTNRIRVVSDVKWGAKIFPNGAQDFLVTVSGDFVDFVGFEVDGSASPLSRTGVGLSGNYVSAQANHVHHVALSAACDSNGASGINAFGSYYSRIDEHIIGNVIHDVGIMTCSMQTAVIHGTTGSILNNLIYDAPGGIETWHDNHHIMIANNTLVNSTVGIAIGSGDYYLTPAPADYITVINNIVVNASKTGYSEQSGTVGANNIFSNNLAFANGTNWALLAGRVNANPIVADPLFVNSAPAANKDYRLQPGSPAIDRGLADGSPSVDIEGVSRRTNIPDLGAFEWQP